MSWIINPRIPGDSNILNLEDNDEDLQKEFGQSLMENAAKMRKENSSSDSKKMGSVHTWCLLWNILSMFNETFQQKQLKTELFPNKHQFWVTSQSVMDDFAVKNMLFGDWERVNKHSGKYSVGTVEKVDLANEDNDISGMGFSANILTFQTIFYKIKLLFMN